MRQPRRCLTAGSRRELRPAEGDAHAAAGGGQVRVVDGVSPVEAHVARLDLQRAARQQHAHRRPRALSVVVIGHRRVGCEREVDDDVTAQLPVVAWGATVPGTYPTPEAGTRTPYVLYGGPWGQAALRLRYVHNAGGWYA